MLDLLARDRINLLLRIERILGVIFGSMNCRFGVTTDGIWIGADHDRDETSARSSRAALA